MQPHGDRLRHVGIADDHRRLVPQPFAAAEDHELGMRRALERHFRAGDDVQGGAPLQGVCGDGLAAHPRDRRIGERAGFERRDDQRGQ